MSQKEFAEKILDMDYRQYNRYEHSVCPSLEVALKISYKLKIPVEEIFRLAD